MRESTSFTATTSRPAASRRPALPASTSGLHPVHDASQPLADHDMMQRAVERMTKTAMRLQTLAPKLAEAKQTVEFTDERRKMIFSKCVVSFFNAGKISTAEAEHRARSCAEYFDGISGIMLQHGTALEVIEENRALVTLFEASRTVVSLEKSKLNL